jgi:Uma2 family endonuclease
MATAILPIESAGEQTVPDDVLYEVIDGQIVELPPMGTRQEITAGVLHLCLGQFVETQKLGRAVMETLFDLTNQVGRKRRPDVAFVSQQRWPRSKPIPETDGWQVVPNLAVEVTSRTNPWDEVMEKVKEYFQVGVERVWVVSPRQLQVHVFETAHTVRIVTLDDDLTDEQLLPGFRLPLRELFECASPNESQ